MQGNVAPLKIGQEAFLVASLIERCPRVMMLRELVQNGIDAAVHAPEGARRVRLSGLEIDGVRKLAIWNSGRGMSADDLYRMGDISTAIRNSAGSQQRYGMGAKVAALGSNPLGVRYRSCRDGRVYECLFGQRDGVYGRVRRAGVDGQLSEIIEVTDLAVSEGADAAQDWTEVVLFGRRHDQDTVANPYDNDPPMGPNWIAETLYRRYWQIPEGVTIVLAEGLHEGGGERTLRLLGDRPSTRGARREVAISPDGVKVHYLFDPADPERPWETLSSRAELQQTFGLLALVHRGEMYRTRAGSQWAYGAAAFGVAFAPRHYSIVVELPADYAVAPNTYRMFLQGHGSQQSELLVDAFAELARNLRPPWLLEQQREFESQSGASDDLRADILELARKLGVPPAAADHENSAHDLPFRIVLLRDEQDIRDRWLLGRAAMFEPKTKELFINTGYESVGKLAEEALASRPGVGASVRARARAGAERAMIARVCRAAVHALSKASDRDGWNEGNITRALSPESFSAVAEDLSGFLDPLVQELEVRNVA